MTEDAAYRSSTQYKLWSFTPAQISAFRASTNALAASRVRAAIKRAREAQKLNNEDVGEEKEVDCLTVSEEERLVGYYCGKTMELADLFEFPTNVKVCWLSSLRACLCYICISII
jgi:cyclin H